MACSAQFWWNWWVSFAAAVGTFAAVIVALFGDQLRAKLFKPGLTIQLENAAGSATPVTLTFDGNSRTEEGRFYHLRISNPKRWPMATQVQVNLLRIEEPGPDGNFQLSWAGEVPLQWSLQEIKPLTQTLGADVRCDLCLVVRNKWLEIKTLVTPHNLDSLVKRRGPTDMIITLQARSAETDSALMRLRISWDGLWSSGDAEMLKHLKIQQL